MPDTSRITVAQAVCQRCASPTANTSALPASSTSSQTPPACIQVHHPCGGCASSRRSITTCSASATGQAIQPQDWNTWFKVTAPNSAASSIAGTTVNAGVAAIGQGRARAGDARKWAANALPTQASRCRCNCSAWLNTGIGMPRGSSGERSISLLSPYCHHRKPIQNRNGDRPCSNPAKDRRSPSPALATGSRDHQAIISAASASMVPPTKPGLISGNASIDIRGCEDMKATAASSCSNRPAARASQRSWRRPIQYTAAPSMAQTAAVQRASSASGTASVTKPRPSAAKHSASQRYTSARPAFPAGSGRRERHSIHQPSARYSAPRSSDDSADQ